MGTELLPVLDQRYRGAANNSVALLWDSRGANYDSATQWGHQSLFHQARAMAFNRFHYDKSINFSVGGYTTSQLRAQIPNVIASSVRHVMIGGGTDNWGVDGGTKTVAQSVADAVADFKAMIGQLVDAGIVVHHLLELPRNHLGDTANHRLWIKLFNQMMQTEVKGRHPGMYHQLPMIADAFIDRDSANGYPFAMATWDGLHPACLGAMTGGRILADHWAAVFPGCRRSFTRQDDVWDATNTYGFATANPLGSGTTGTAGTGVTGTVPTSWAVSRTTGTTLTATVSKMSDPAPAGGPVTRVTLGGGTGGAGKECISVDVPYVNLANYAAGDRIAAYADVETSGLVNVMGVELQWYGTVNMWAGYTGGASTTIAEREVASSRREFKTPDYRATGVDSANSQRARLNIWCDCTGAGAGGVIDMRGLGWKKVPQYA